MHAGDHNEPGKKGTAHMIVTRLIERSLLIMLLFLCVLSTTCNAGEGRESIKIAILPCDSIAITFKKFHPLVTYLQEATGFDIKLLIPGDLAEFERAVKNRDVAFAFQGANIYVQFASMFNREALLRVLNPDGTNTYPGVVIVRNDSSIRTMEELKGKRVMFGAEFSARKWTAARLLFEESGINIDRDLKAYSNATSCEDIAFYVYLKTVDAGVVCDHFFKGTFEEYQELGINAKQFRVIAETKSVPTRVFAARKDMKSDMVFKLYQALLNLNKRNLDHAKILYAAEIGGFQKSNDEDYDAMRVLTGVK